MSNDAPKMRQVDYARRIGINANTLKQWVRAGLPVQQGPGCGKLVLVEEADAWVREHRGASVALGRTSNVYFAQRPDGHIKIGFSSDLPRRLVEIEKIFKTSVRLLVHIDGDAQRERALHRLFARHHVGEEWFRPAPELLTFIRDVSRGNAQCALAALDYRFDTLNARQSAALDDFAVDGDGGAFGTRTIQSLEERGLIGQSVRGTRRYPAPKILGMSDATKKAWSEWKRRRGDASERL